jgi:hypothetical protein
MFTDLLTLNKVRLSEVQWSFLAGLRDVNVAFPCWSLLAYFKHMIPEYLASLIPDPTNTRYTLRNSNDTSGILARTFNSFFPTARSECKHTFANTFTESNRNYLREFISFIYSEQCWPVRFINELFLDL